MVIKISSYYNRKGFHRAYLATNKEPRRVCTLRTKDGRMTSMSYAKYLYTSYYKCDIPDGEQIDHINGDSLDNRIENLQPITHKENMQKRLGGGRNQYIIMKEQGMSKKAQDSFWEECGDLIVKRG